MRSHKATFITGNELVPRQFNGQFAVGDVQAARTSSSGTPECDLILTICRARWKLYNTACGQTRSCDKPKAMLARLTEHVSMLRVEIMR
jgi:hypothetical protein